MRTKVSCFSLVVALAVAGSALGLSARSCEVIPQSLAKKMLAGVKQHHIGTLVGSRPSTLSAFVLGAAPWFEKNNQDDGDYESCGEIGVAKDGTYAMVWVTEHAHTRCAVISDELPPGFRATGITMHVHPYGRSVILNKNDVILSDMSMDEVGAVFRLQPRHTTTFSNEDYASGPGFLATRSGAIFQNGSASTVCTVSGKAIKVNLIANGQPLPALASGGYILSGVSCSP